MKRIGVDVGGTFTDLILVDEETGRISVEKVPSTPDDPARGSVAGVRDLCERAGVTLGELDGILHGTTVATNIVITHSGAEVGLLTTRASATSSTSHVTSVPITSPCIASCPGRQTPLSREDTG